MKTFAVSLILATACFTPACALEADHCARAAFPGDGRIHVTNICDVKIKAYWEDEDGRKALVLDPEETDWGPVQGKVKWWARDCTLGGC
jgi:hypothetical protein